MTSNVRPIRPEPKTETTPSPGIFGLLWRTEVDPRTNTRRLVGRWPGRSTVVASLKVEFAPACVDGDDWAVLARVLSEYGEGAAALMVAFGDEVQ